MTIANSEILRSCGLKIIEMMEIYPKFEPVLLNDPTAFLLSVAVQAGSSGHSQI